MKILYYLDGLNRGGVEIIVSQLANFFCENGNEIHIIYLYKDMHDLIDEFSSDVKIHPLPFINKKTPYFQYIKYLWRLVRLLKNIQPEIIHAHNSSFSYFYLALAVYLAKLKSENIRTLHFMGFFLEKKSWIDKVRFFFDKKASELLQSSIVSVSANIKSYVDDNYPLNHSVLITNGIDSKKIINTNTTKESLGINVNGFIGIYTSRLCEGKNHRLLIQAWGKVVGSYPSALLILIGDGPLRLECQDYCRELGISNNVLFTGSIPNVEDYLRIADIGVFPSESEGLSLGLCEMMAAGLPVVVSDIPAFRLMIQDGNNGVFFDTYDSDDLSNKIIIILGDKKVRDELGKNANKYILENYTLQSMLEKYQNLYHEIKKNQ